MATHTVYEIEDPQRLLDTKGVWRIELDKSIHTWDDEAKKYTYGDTLVFRASQYLDAERAGFSGYVTHRVELPVCVVLEAADAIRSGEVPSATD